MANNGELQSDIEAMRKDMMRLRDDFTSVMNDLVGSGKDTAGAIKDKAKDAGKRAVAATETQIKERPFLSILVVFLIGMLLGKMVDQRLRG